MGNWPRVNKEAEFVFRVCVIFVIGCNNFFSYVLYWKCQKYSTILQNIVRYYKPHKCCWAYKWMEIHCRSANGCIHYSNYRSMQCCPSSLKRSVNTSFTHRSIIVITKRQQRCVKKWWTFLFLLKMWWILHTLRNLTYIFKRNIFSSCKLKIRPSSFVWLVPLCKSYSPSAQPAALLLWASGAFRHVNHVHSRL